MLGFRLGRVTGVTALGGLEYLTVNSNFRQFCWLHTKTRPSEVGDEVTPPRLWTTSGLLSSRACLTSLSWAFWIHGRTHVVVISEFGEIVLHSGLWEFHICTLCREVSHQGRNEGYNAPDAESLGVAEKT